MEPIFKKKLFSLEKISNVINFAKLYSSGTKLGYSTGRVSTNIRLIEALKDNEVSTFGFGPNILFKKEIRGYGSGFTPFKIVYGISGWGRDYISLGIIGVFLFLLIFMVIRGKIKKLLKNLSEMPINVQLLSITSYLLCFVLVFDYFFYSSVNFVSGFPLFLIMLFLGLSENFVKNKHV